MATEEPVFIFTPHASFEQDHAALLRGLRRQGFQVQVYTYTPDSNPGFLALGAGKNKSAGSTGGARSKAPVLGVETGWVLSDRASRLCAPGGCSVALTAIERGFFKLLLENGQRQARRERLVTLWEQVPDTAQARVDARISVMVARLRRKVLKRLGTPLPLKVLYGEGYLFTAVLFEQT